MTVAVGQGQANSTAMSKEESIGEEREDAVDCGRVDDSVCRLDLGLNRGIFVLP